MLVAVSINKVSKIHKRPSGDKSPFQSEYANLGANVGGSGMKAELQMTSRGRGSILGPSQLCAQADGFLTQGREAPGVAYGYPVIRQQSANTGRHSAINLAVHIHAAASRGVSLSYRFSTRAFISEYAASMSLLSAAAFVAVPGLSFTWRMNLPVPCNKRPGSGSAAP